MKERMQGTLALLLGTFIWGMAFIAQSVGMETIGPFTFQAIRCMLGVIFLFLVTFFFDWKIGMRASLQKWKNKKLWISGIICGTALFAATSLQQVGLVYTAPGKAGFLTAMYIVLVPVLGIFVHRKPGINAVVSVLLALVGLYLLSFTDMGSINIGDILLTGCALAFAVQILLIDRLAPDLDGLRLNCVQSLVVSLLSVPCIFLNRETVGLQTILDCWLPLGFAGVLSMGVGYSMQIIGQKRLEPTAASLIMSLESVFAALGGWLILHNTMTPSELTGCTLVFAGVIVSQVPVHKLFARK
jgi:hypothetical protein